MFLGHGLLAFALVVLAADAAGWPRERALVAGGLAGAFAMAPDVDMLYAPVGLLEATGPADAATEFWATGNRIHRSVTHSLVVGVGAAAGAATWAVGTRGARAGAACLLAGLVAAALVVSGPLGAAVMTAFCLAVAAIAEWGVRRRVQSGVVGGTALVGLLTHPFGDVLTGQPPAFLYPFDVTLVAARPTVFADPTLNLLAPLFLELGTVALALAAWARLHDRRVRDGLAARAAAGAGVGAVALLLPPPTLEVSYHFVLGLVGAGTLLSAPLPRLEVSSAADLRRHPWQAAVTWLSAVTLGAVTYTGGYLLL